MLDLKIACVDLERGRKNQMTVFEQENKGFFTSEAQTFNDTMNF